MADKLHEEVTHKRWKCYLNAVTMTVFPEVKEEWLCVRAHHWEAQSNHIGLINASFCNCYMKDPHKHKDSCFAEIFYSLIQRLRRLSFLVGADDVLCFDC